MVTWLRLDRGYRVLGVEGDMRKAVSQHVGSVLWDAYPDAADQFLLPYEKAWENGWENVCVRYRGCVVQAHASRCGDELVVCYKILPLSGLAEALEQLCAEFTTPYAAAGREAVEPSGAVRRSRRGAAASHLRLAG